MSCWFGVPHTSGLAARELAPDMLMAFENTIAGVVRDAAPTLTAHVSAPPRCPSSAVWRQLIKVGAANGLARKPIASLQRSAADALIGVGRDENERRTVTPDARKR